jgi:hypothetical protein
LADSILLLVIFGLRPPLRPDSRATANPARVRSTVSSLHFGEAGHDVKEEPSRRRAGVDGVGETLELDALLVQLADQIDQLLDATAQAIQLPDDQRVSRVA